MQTSCTCAVTSSNGHAGSTSKLASRYRRMRLLMNVKDEAEVRGHAPERELRIGRGDADHRVGRLGRGHLVQVVNGAGDAADARVQEEREVLLAELEADARVREVVADLVEERRTERRVARELLDDPVRVALEDPAVSARQHRGGPRPERDPGRARANAGADDIVRDSAFEAKRAHR